MATGTFYLRPSADISLGHPVYPETLTAGYLAINETVSDATATYIGFAAPPGAVVAYTSEFALSMTDSPRITRIISAKIGGDGSVHDGSQNSGSAICTIKLYVSDSLITTITEESMCPSGGSTRNDLRQDGNYLKEIGTTEGWYDHADIYDYRTFLTTINNALVSGSFPSVTVEITNSTDDGITTGTKSGGVVSYVSQFYIELECEYEAGLNIHHKVNGSWLQAQAAYQKQNGAWVEITEDACKEVLQNNLLSSGNA